MLDALERLRCSARHVAVVALAEPPVHEDRHLRARERDPHRLDGPCEVRVDLLAASGLRFALVPRPMARRLDL